MAQKQQTSVGGSIEVPASGTVELRHRFDGGEWIGIVEMAADTSDVVNANAFIDQQTGNKVPIQTRADDGPDSPKGGNYPIRLESGAPNRFLTLIQAESGDELVFEFENIDTAAHWVRATASAASTVEIALQNG